MLSLMVSSTATRHPRDGISSKRLPAKSLPWSKPTRRFGQKPRYLSQRTRVVVTMIQVLDFFGDGTRIPLIVVSPYSQGGAVVHTYYDHVSILKFIEYNWGLPTISSDSRDNLPNPLPSSDPYVPANQPAIGNLLDMFNFPGD